MLKNLISQDKTKNFTSFFFKRNLNKILYTVINFYTVILIQSEFTNSKFVMIWLAAKLKVIFALVTGSQSVIPGPAAPVRPRSLLEVHIFRPHHTTTESETLGWAPTICIFTADVDKC